MAQRTNRQPSTERGGGRGGMPPSLTGPGLGPVLWAPAPALWWWWAVGSVAGQGGEFRASHPSGSGP
jgi:hypothetical protein